MTTLFFMLLDYLEHLDYLVRLDLFYESTSSIVCLAIADDHELAVDDALADIGIACRDVLHRALNWVVVKFHRVIVRVKCIDL